MLPERIRPADPFRYAAETPTAPGNRLSTSDKWGDAFIEGSSWQIYPWSVFPDPLGLITLIGGDAAFISSWTRCSSAPPTFDDSVTGFRPQSHRNGDHRHQASTPAPASPFSTPPTCLITHGRPWKTSSACGRRWNCCTPPTRTAFAEIRTTGQTLAGYVFFAMGFYPVCPGVNSMPWDRR
ncbi:MAG: glycoside hydrolase family 92 protein [Haliscomenobacter sp.]|nr:glycoside hydrolase family 92 protein [Haliscomenobacter sp.]